MTKLSLSKETGNAIVLVAALGYFVDFYDFMLYNVVRVPSLIDLHLTGDALTGAGLYISNCQLVGLLIGSWLWGVLGDKFGRKSCLFASIIVYSTAAFFCGAVQQVDQYALARFFTGLGVAGEVGAGITLIAERLTPSRRGYGICFFITLGFLGLITATVVTDALPWRLAYLVGGIAGMVLLFARLLVGESQVYLEMAQRVHKRGGLGFLFRSRGGLRKYAAAIVVMAPTTFIAQMLWTLSPELARSEGLGGTVKASFVLAIGYGAASVCSILACFASERLRSRKRAMLIFLMLGCACFAAYILFPLQSMFAFYLLNSLVGLTFGVWVSGVSLITEGSETSIRSTVTTTAPNFARALVIPMNLGFAYLKPAEGSLIALGHIGLIVFLCAFWGWTQLAETYGRDLTAGFDDPRKTN